MIPVISDINFMLTHLYGMMIIDIPLDIRIVPEFRKKACEVSIRTTSVEHSNREGQRMTAKQIFRTSYFNLS